MRQAAGMLALVAGALSFWACSSTAPDAAGAGGGGGAGGAAGTGGAGGAGGTSGSAGGGGAAGSGSCDGFLVAGVCSPWAAQPEGYVPGRSAVVTVLQIPVRDASGELQCCADLGERSKDFLADGIVGGLDNAFEAILESISTFDPTFVPQADIDAAIADGSVVLLFDGLGLEGPDDDFLLARLLGTREGATSAQTSAAGEGTFLARRAAFAPGTGVPAFLLPARLDGDALAAGPGAFALPLPLGALILDLPVEEARLTASPTAIHRAGVSYVGGVLSGYVLVDSFFERMNDYAARSCACLAHQGPIFALDDTGHWHGDCVADSATLCPDSRACTNVGGAFCSLGPALLEASADIELDEAREGYEGLSVGLQFEAAPAQLVGVEAP